MNLRRLIALPEVREDRTSMLAGVQTRPAQMSLWVNRDWAGASCRSSRVRNAPLATVGAKKSSLSR
jgi:hypothetical protein